MHQGILANSEAFLERILGLPRGEIKRNREAPEPETTALLKLIESLPWLLEIAEYNFDPVLSELVLHREAAIIKVNQRKEEILASKRKSND